MQVLPLNDVMLLSRNSCNISSCKIEENASNKLPFFFKSMIFRFRAILGVKKTQLKPKRESRPTGRHLSQTARNLPESLGPTGRGVGHHAHVVAHVSEVLGQRDSFQEGRHGQ